MFIGVAGAAVFIVHAWALPTRLALPVVLSGVATAVSELSQVLLPSGEGVSVGWAVIVCSVVALGPIGTAWVQFIGATITAAVRRTPLLPFIFNLGNMVLTATGGAYLFQILGGRPETLDSARSWVALGVAMGLIYTSNALIAAVAFAAYKRSDVVSTWISSISQTLPSFVALFGFGVGATAAYLHWGSPALGVLLGLVIVLHYGFKRYTAILQERDVAGFLSRSEARAGRWREHSERIVGYSTAIAAEMGLRRNDTTLLRYAAWLHDVALWDRRVAGVSVNPGGMDGLNGDEAPSPGMLMEPSVRAAVRGAAAVATLGPLVPVATIIRHQAERFDGRGGPDGLSGESIPIGSRILAVAEWFDQLTVTGPQPLTMAEAVARIQEEAGTRFCPRVAGALASLVARNDPALAGAFLGEGHAGRARDTRRLADQLRALLSSPEFDLRTRQALGSGVRRKPPGPGFQQAAVQPGLFTLYELGQVLNSSLQLERVLAIVGEVAEELTGVPCRVLLDAPPDGGGRAAGDAPSVATAPPPVPDEPALAIPMISRGRRVGALLLIGVTGEAIGDRQLDLLSIIASQAALAAENAKLYSEMEVRLREISEMKRFTDVVLNSLTSGVIVCDGDGRVTLTTPRAREIVLSLNQASGGPVPVVEQVLDPRTAALLRETLTSGRQAFERYQLNEPWGRATIEIHTSPLVDETRGTTGAVAVVHDVTERVRLEDQMQRIERLSILGELAASAAHEIRNPLTSIRGFVQLMSASGDQPARTREYLPIIIREIDRIDGMIREMLALARRSAPNLAPCDLSGLLEECLQLIDNQAFARRVNVVRAYPRDLPPINCDRDQIKQVFLNLCTNALQAMPKGGELRLEAEARPEEGAVLVRVIDSGVGIPREYLGRIFDPFFTTKDEGTGLGLSVTYGIVQKHGGRISVESTVGEGSVFTVWLRTDGEAERGQEVFRASRENALETPPDRKG